LAIGLLIAVAAIFYTLRNVSLSELTDSLQSFPILYYIPLTGLIVANFTTRTYRWSLLIRPMKRVRGLQLFPVFMIGLLGNLLPMRGGEILRAYLLTNKFKIPFSGSLATIMVERVFDIFTLLLLFSGVLLFQADIFSSNVVWGDSSLEDMAYRFGSISLVMIIVLITFVYLIINKKSSLIRIVGWLSQWCPSKWKEKLENLVHTFSQGVMAVKSAKSLFYIFFVTLLDWVWQIWFCYIILMGFDIQYQPLLTSILIAVTMPIFMTLLPTPAFLGSMQASIYVVLHEIMNQSQLAAASYGMFFWGWTFSFVVVAGTISVLKEHLTLRKLAELEEKAEVDYKSTP